MVRNADGWNDRVIVREAVDEGTDDHGFRVIDRLATMKIPLFRHMLKVVQAPEFRPLEHAISRYLG